MHREDVFRILLTLYDRRNRVSNEYVLQELRPYASRTFQTIILKNEALNQVQIAQKAIFDFDQHSSRTEDYHHLALEFLRLFQVRTGLPVSEKVLTLSHKGGVAKKPRNIRFSR